MAAAHLEVKKPRRKERCRGQAGDGKCGLFQDLLVNLALESQAQGSEETSNDSHFVLVL